MSPSIDPDQKAAEIHPGGDPLARLPHTGPARLPDHVVQIDPPGRVVVEMGLSPHDVRLNESGRLPAMLLVELMAQAGGLLIEVAPGASGDHAVLAGLKRMHLHDTATGGQTLRAEAILVKRLGEIYLLESRVTAGGRLLAHGRLQLRHVRAGVS